MPEVAGDAAMLVDPQDSDQIVKAIQKILDHEDVKNSLIRKGLERAKAFSWETMAGNVLKIYHEVRI
jgi:glycosyltransferase involved in cell wall biosynthesis